MRTTLKLRRWGNESACFFSLSVVLKHSSSCTRGTRRRKTVVYLVEPGLRRGSKCGWYCPIDCISCLQANPSFQQAHSQHPSFHTVALLLVFTPRYSADQSLVYLTIKVQAANGLTVRSVTESKKIINCCRSSTWWANSILIYSTFS